MDYVVIVPELHYQEVVVDAKSEEEALRLAQDGGGEYGDSYYSRSLEPTEQEWGVQVFNVFDKTYPYPAFQLNSNESSKGE